MGRFNMISRGAAPVAPTLAALTLQSSSASTGVSGSTNILGRTVGSTLTLTNNVGGVFSINSATAVLSWSSSIASGANTPTIRETLAGATNTPRDTSPTVTASSGLVITDATGGSSKFAGKIPVFRNASVAMTTLVAQNDEAIDVQAVVGTPYSPLATTISISGPNISLFDKIAGGKLVIKASARASITKDTTYALTVQASNAAGASESCTLSIYVAADADCRFVSFDKGTDVVTGATGQTPGNPWKHCPDTNEWTGPATTFTGATASKCIFFEGVDLGAKHATTLCRGLYSTWDEPQHNGTISKQLRYCYTGWGGQAKFTGADNISGSWSAAASGDIYSSGVSGVEKITLAAAAEFFHIVSFGESQGFMAQYPRPNVLSQSDGAQSAVDGMNNYDNTAGTSDGGFKRVQYSTNAGDTFTPRFYYPGSGSTDCYIEDAQLNARFNGTNWSRVANGIGCWVKIWGPGGNNVAIVPVVQFDASTNRLYVKNFNAYTAGGSYTSYALLNSPYDVQVSGQYALQADGLAVIAKRPNSNQAVIAKRSVGATVGKQPYVTHHQAWFERYVNGIYRNPASNQDASGGCAMQSYNADGVAGLQVYGLRSHQCFNTQENSTLFGAYGSHAGFVDFIFDRFHLTESLHGAGSVTDIAFWGRQTGGTAQGGPTVAQIQAYPTGKCGWWFFDDDCCTRSLVYWNRLRGVHFIEPVIGRLVSTHGDGLPWYQDAVTSYADHNLVESGLGITAQRWRTSSAGAQPDRTIPFNNTFLRCVVLGFNAGNYGVDLYDGDPGALYQQCVFMADPADTTNSTCFHGGSGYANMTLLNCVANGVRMGTAAGGNGEPATWTLDTCYFTGDSYKKVSGSFTQYSILADDVANSRRVLSCTRGTNKVSWDYGTAPSDWLTTLQRGATAGTTKLGPFVYV